MSAIAPFAASSFAPEERPQQLPAKESRRTGRHEPIRSSTSRIAARGAGLGITMAAGVAAGINYLEHDLQLSLLAGGQVGAVAAGMAFVGAWTERRRMHDQNRPRPRPARPGRRAPRPAVARR